MATQTPAPSLICPVCGTDNPATRQFCRKCASDLRAPVRDPNAPVAAPPVEVPMRPIVVGGGIALLIVALIIGANDVTNPAARRAGTPVSGMPILDVDHAKSIIVIKRSMGRGYAGIDNELYVNPKTGMLFADAKQGLADLVAAVKAL